MEVLCYVVLTANCCYLVVFLKAVYVISYIINDKLQLHNLEINDPALPVVGHDLLKIIRKICDNHGSSHTVLFYFTLEFHCV
jgi:hypothetical protein